ncbi:hypothetical protein MVLG_07020 [Microbotryum lychnidis-dioicae p1A1 Lamole]|uniref:Protein kinase domain-containing protein n=1 Tax=Microbotryum lychnidis-dioicae (strain p1A1 Lamole / MvSl-1064) TaxID=683840 RepID=U5HJ26_USTV1|nr:hypothetical protein MVLG_07020 [Microbotryum lychnidis-dioicae p1A1 Lamole]|eukprot:KDE02424.1 hypothetical protein MVLG_07020 [Microbotryum lychnidis-dioicae p1A1 Lamole]
MSFVSPSTANVKLDMLTQITKALDGGTLPPKVAQHLALLELAQSLSPHKSQVEDARLPRPPAPPQDKFLLFWPPHSEVSRRTLELLVLRNPTPLPVPLVDFARPLEPKPLPLPLPHIPQVFDQLLTVLAILAERNFHHRDLSVGHILHYQGHLVLVDWSAGIRAPLSDSVLVGAEESSGYLKGSPESAPLNWLESNNGVGACPPIPYQPAHALESTIYCLLVVLAHRIAAQEEIWRTLRLQRRREERESPIDYFYLRCMVWEHGPSPFQRHLVRRRQLLAAIRGEDAALGDLVDVVTEEWPLWPFMRSIDNGGKALWAAIYLKFHAFGGNAQ